MSFEKFKLLMWKNYRLRRFHWIMTLVEFFLPILTAYAMGKITATLGGSTSSQKNATYFSEYGIQEFISRGEHSFLLYTPSNNFTDSLMLKVKDALDAINKQTEGKTMKKRKAEFPEYSKTRFRFNSKHGRTEVKPMDSEADLEYFISRYNRTDYSFNYIFGVVFYDLKSNDTPPDILNYALRDSNSWGTQSLYPTIMRSGPVTNDPYYNQGFSPVQVVIDNAFTLLKTNKNPWDSKQIFFQPFPYPEYASDETPRAVVAAVLSMVVIFVFLIISVPLIRDVIEEKDSGVKELMKLAGLEEWLIWVCWFVHAFIISAISFTIVTIILKHPYNGEGSEGIHFVTFPVIWITLMLYCIANIAFCFLFCALFQRASVATSVFLISYLVFMLVSSYIEEKKIKFLMKLLLLFPAGAFSQGFSKIRYFEIQGIEFGWSSMTLKENDDDSVSLLFALGMLLFDAVLYFFLTFYIIAVNPGKFGAAKSPFFIFQGLFSRFKDENTQPLRNLDDKPESEFIEPVPSNLEATVQIKDLYKSFGFVNAVNGVNLNVYKGEITALLGHNGAGKTTTMSILTGLTSPTAGSIYYKDMDVFKNMLKFREKLGMCPQENRLFPYLTVLDHLLFFGMLKGVSRQEALYEAEEYLRLMEMQSKRFSLCKELSGGMKRKLCLCISLMGKADTLILDEPTSGMDVQSRRKIWDLLLEMRGNRTIILTTHYMEEADALGDRIAIMHHGSIVCYGTPIFLKKAYGTGYELTITKAHDNIEQLTETILDILPNASKEHETPEYVVYKLPLTDTAKFPLLFRDLEANKRELGIREIGVACTTMEHVFLKVGGISIYDSNEYSSNATVTDAAPGSAFFKTTRGLHLMTQQTGALWYKKFLYTTRNLFPIFTRIILPTIIATILLYSLKNEDTKPEPALDLSLRSYPGAMVMFQNNDVKSTRLYDLYTNYVKEHGASVMNADNVNVLEGLLAYARKNLLVYNKNVLTAAEFNSTSTKVLYNRFQTHSLPIAVNAFSNVLLKSVASSDNVGIITQNHPVKAITPTFDLFETPFIVFFFWFIALAFYTFDCLAYFAGFINMERLNGFKHIQIMSHVSMPVYWLGTFLFDLSFFALIMVARIAVFKIIGDYSGILNFTPHFGVLVLMLVLFAISGLLFVYCVSFISNSAEGSYALFFIGNSIAAIIVVVYHLFDVMIIKTDDSFDWSLWVLLFYVAKFVIRFTPPMNFSLLFINFLRIWDNNSRCMNAPDFAKKACAVTFPQKSYLEHPSHDNPFGLLTGIEYLLFDILLYAFVLGVLNMGIVEHWWNQLKNSIYGIEKTINDVGDSDVQKEYNRVLDMRNNATSVKQVSLLADGLRKNYIKWFRPFTAVADVNFIVQPGECFGLLGVNGAGKTTTFKMLTADILPTKGDAAIEGIRMSSNKMQYLSMAGYCAQTNCFVEELTGREMLTLIASLRGVMGDNSKKTVDKWISILGLEEYQNQPCGTYSGGNKRKLCTAMSLIGDPRVVFLDEPTSGVDPVSRRKLYDVMKQSKHSGQAVVLTSHSMEECENLCDRLTIMAAGVMRCIGTTQHLKKQYAQGFSALIKIRDTHESDGELSQLKSDVMNVFSEMFCVLKDEHKGLLYYQIKDTNLPWSTLFERMEGIKHRHQNIIEDYVLTDTTLEEVFISFAKTENSMD